MKNDEETATSGASEPRPDGPGPTRPTASGGGGTPDVRRREFLRRLTGLGLAHIAIRYVGNNPAAQQGGPPPQACGVVVGGVVTQEDLDCGSMAANHTPHRDNDCGKVQFPSTGELHGDLMS